MFPVHKNLLSPFSTFRYLVDPSGKCGDCYTDMADHPYAVPDAQGPCTACVNGWRTCPSSAVAHFKFCRDNDDDEYELDSQWVGPGDVTVPCTDDDDPHPAEPDPVPPDWLRVNETTVTDEQTGLSKTWYYLQNTLTGETVGPYSE